MSDRAPVYQNPEFDDFAEDYDAALEKGISVSGESKDYFAQKRAEWVASCLEKLRFTPRQVLDFGCGTGSATPYLLKLPGVEKLLGLEVSARSIAVAQRLHGNDSVRFALSSEYQPEGNMDLAFCNGVFHHIPLSERAGAVNYILRCLRPGGLFAYWENNPWNPGTRLVMSRIPFDKDAITLTPPESVQMLKAAGFEVVRRDFQFIFPKSFGFLRFLEAPLAKFPLGAQYLVLVRKL